jgi:hypothetical protein
MIGHSMGGHAASGFRPGSPRQGVCSSAFGCLRAQRAATRHAFVPFKQVATLTDAIPGVRLTVVIPRAGHTPMWEQPEAWTRSLQDFLEGR